MWLRLLGLHLLDLPGKVSLGHDGNVEVATILEVLLGVVRHDPGLVRLR